MSNRLAPTDPSDIKDYAIQWSALLTGESETSIASSTWTVTPAGLTIVSSGIATTQAVVWVSGGVAGVNYDLTNRIVTGGPTPRTHERTIQVPCRQL